MEKFCDVIFASFSGDVIMMTSLTWCQTDFLSSISS